jgi:hypothetical protein
VSKAAAARQTVAERVSSVEAAGITGIAFAVLYVLSLRLITSGLPAWDAGTAEVESALADPGRRRSVLVGYSLTPFAAASFLWFVAVIRRRIPAQESFVSTVFVAGSTVFVALYLVGTSMVGAPYYVNAELGATLISAPALETVRAVGYGLVFVQAIRVQVLVILSASTLGRRSHVMPRWLVAVGYLIGIIQVVNATLFEPLVLWFPLWVLTASVFVLLRRGRLAPREGADGERESS